MKERVISRPPERGRCSLQRDTYGSRMAATAVGVQERKQQRVVASSSSDHAAVEASNGSNRNDNEKNCDEKEDENEK